MQMTRPDFKLIARNAAKAMDKHSPQILLGVGIAGMITTVVLAVKATPKALKLIEEAENPRIVDKTVVQDELTTVETIKVAWKPYAPAMITGILSVTCLIGSNSVSTRRTAALATAYKISETALSEYKDKVIEKVGEKKEQAIRDEIAKDKIQKNPVNESNIIITGDGDVLCYDSLSGQYFKSTMDKIKQAEIDTNFELFNDMYISLNEFYNKLGIRNTKLGGELGWNIDSGKLQIDISSQIAENGQPCLVLDYEISPKYEFNRMSY